MTTAGRSAVTTRSTPTMTFAACRRACPIPIRRVQDVTAAAMSTASRPSPRSRRSRQVAGDLPDRPRPDARPARLPAAADGARLVRVVALRGIQADVQLPARLHRRAGRAIGSGESARRRTGARLRRHDLPGGWPAHKGVVLCHPAASRSPAIASSQKLRDGCAW
jgi:hypothetical protein